MTEIVEVYEPQNLIEDVYDAEAQIIEVIEQGPMGPSGPSVETMAFTKQGVLTAPFSSSLSWLLDGNSVIEAVNVVLGTAPTTATVFVDVLRNGVSIYPAGVGRAALAIGTQKAYGAVGAVLANNDALTIALASSQTIPGAADLVATIRRRLV